MRLHRPIATTGGAIVVWISHLDRPDFRALCFDSHLTPRWDRWFTAGRDPPTRSQQGTPQLLGTGGRLLAIRSGHDAAGGLAQGWMGAVGVDNGDWAWGPRQWPDNVIPANAGVTPDGSIAFVVAGQRARRKNDALRWQLTALDIWTGEELWKGPEQESPPGSVLGAPVVTSSHLYLQRPLKPARKPGHLSRVQGKGLLEAYWRA
jgi:hypothetical protein